MTKMNFAELMTTLKDEETQKLHDCIRGFMRSNQKALTRRQEWINKRQAQCEELKALMTSLQEAYDAGNLTNDALKNLVLKQSNITHKDGSDWAKDSGDGPFKKKRILPEDDEDDNY